MASNVLTHQEAKVADREYLIRQGAFKGYQTWSSVTSHRTVDEKVRNTTGSERQC